jgi:hypothetical protein
MDTPEDLAPAPAPKPEFCPSCGGRLAPGAEACPNCPWSRMDESAAKHRSRFSWQIPAPLALAALVAAIGFFGWRILDGFLTPPQPPPAPVQPVKKDDRVVMDTHVLKQKRDSAWKVSGKVYDLVTLAPVSGARVTFRDRRDGKALTALADARGRYRASLPKISEGGYDVAVESRGYAGFLEEMSPPYKAQDRSRRLEALAEARRSELLHVPLLPEEHDDQVPYDLVLMRR